MSEKHRFSITDLPQLVKRTYTYAERIAKEHSPLAALYFMLYPLLSVRQIGYLLLRLSGWFIVLSPRRVSHTTSTRGFYTTC